MTSPGHGTDEAFDERTYSSDFSSSSTQEDGPGSENMDDPSSVIGYDPTRRVLSSSASFIDSINSGHTKQRGMFHGIFKKKGKDYILKFRKRFPVVMQQENVIYYIHYKCVMERGISSSRGKLYVTNHDLFFYGKPLVGKSVHIQIPYQNILHMEKSSREKAIHITTTSGSPYSLTHFKHVDSAFAVLAHLWHCHMDGTTMPQAPASISRIGSNSGKPRADPGDIKSYHRRNVSKDDLWLVKKPKRQASDEPGHNPLIRRGSMDGGQKQSVPLHPTDEDHSMLPSRSTTNPPFSHGFTLSKDTKPQSKRVVSATTPTTEPTYNLILADDTFPVSPSHLVTWLFGYDPAINRSEPIIDSLTPHALVRAPSWIHGQHHDSNSTLYLNWMTSKCHANIIRKTVWSGSGSRKLLYEIPVQDGNLRQFYPSETFVLVMETQQWVGEARSCLDCSIIFPGASSTLFSSINLRLCYSILRESGHSRLIISANIDIILEQASQIEPYTPSLLKRSATSTNSEVTRTNYSQLQSKFAQFVKSKLSSLSFLLHTVPQYRSCTSGQSLPPRRSISQKLHWIATFPWRLFIFVWHSIQQLTQEPFIFHFLYVLAFYSTFPIFLYIEDVRIRIHTWYTERLPSYFKSKRFWFWLSALMLLYFYLFTWWYNSQPPHGSAAQEMLKYIQLLDKEMLSRVRHILEHKQAVLQRSKKDFLHLDMLTAFLQDYNDLD